MNTIQQRYYIIIKPTSRYKIKFEIWDNQTDELTQKEEVKISTISSIAKKVDEWKEKLNLLNSK